MDSIQVLVHTLIDDGTFPNNADLPLLVYPRALPSPDKVSASAFEALFAANAWPAAWRNGVYPFHHYHSTAHEVLGVYQGTATVQFGGEKGFVLTVGSGDVVVIPAGVAHKNLGSSADFRVVGAYPLGQTWDTNYGRPGERPQADQGIARIPLPESDPAFGQDGPLVKHWFKEESK